ncbi:TPA: hypothetical protein ACGG7T_001715 [Vibrio cholerae]
MITAEEAIELSRKDESYYLEIIDKAVTSAAKRKFSNTALRSETFEKWLKPKCEISDVEKRVIQIIEENGFKLKRFGNALIISWGNDQ